MKKTTNNDLLFFRQETIPGGMLEHMECNYYISEEKTFYVIQENLDINGTPRGITTIEMPRDEFFGEIFDAIVDDGGVYGFRSRISAIVDNYLRICFGTLIWEVEAYLEDNDEYNKGYSDEELEEDEYIAIKDNTRKILEMRCKQNEKIIPTVSADFLNSFMETFLDYCIDYKDSSYEEQNLIVGY